MGVTPVVAVAVTTVKERLRVRKPPGQEALAAVVEAQIRIKTMLLPELLIPAAAVAALQEAIMLEQEGRE